MKLKVLAIAAVLIVVVSGCTVIEEPINLSSMPPGPSPYRRTVNNNMAPGQQGMQAPNSIDAALVWSEKYEKVLTEVEKLKKYNAELAAANGGLKGKMLLHQKELLQTKKELKDANAVLLDMRLELSQWKKDILGFRNEMRQAQQALLAASGRILRELGAEIPNSVPENATAVNEN